MSVQGYTTEGRRYGPSAFGDDLRRFVSLTVTLAATDFKLAYFNSILGYVWSLMRPLLFFGVLYFVFTDIFHVGSNVPYYSVELLLAIILWTFFLQATAGSVQSMLSREGLLRKMRFPRMVVPLAITLTALFTLTTNMLPIFGLALIRGITPTWAWLELIPVILLLAVLASGIGMLLSVLYVRARDIQPIWDVLSQLLFYAAPIIYPVYYYNHSTTIYTAKNCALNPQSDLYYNIHTGKLCKTSTAPIGNNLHLHFIGHFLMTNPIAALIAQARHALVGGPEGVNPSAAFALGGWEYALIPLGIILVVFVLGVVVFHHEAPRISENL
jgi:ABC-2 type transport system permease protein